MRSIVLLLLALLSACATGAGGSPAADAGSAAVERDVLERVNRHRAERRLPPLVWNGQVAAAARRHSAAAAQGTVALADGNGRQRARGLATRMPVKDWGESVARVAADPGAAGAFLFAALVSNPADRSRLEGAYEYTGIGVARDGTGTYYLTQLFVNSAAVHGLP